MAINIQTKSRLMDMSRLGRLSNLPEMDIAGIRILGVVGADEGVTVVGTLDGDFSTFPTEVGGHLDIATTGYVAGKRLFPWAGTLPEDQLASEIGPGTFVDGDFQLTANTGVVVADPAAGKFSCLLFLGQ